MSSLSTPAFLVDEGGVLVFYNEAAGIAARQTLRGAGDGRPQRSGARCSAPSTTSGEPIPYDELPLVTAVRDGRPAHAELTVRSADGAEHEVEASAFPILTAHGSPGRHRRPLADAAARRAATERGRREGQALGHARLDPLARRRRRSATAATPPASASPSPTARCSPSTPAPASATSAWRSATSRAGSTSSSPTSTSTTSRASSSSPPPSARRPRS